MANTLPTINMDLPVPIPGVDPGPDYALNINACLAIIDSHNHSSGQGVAIGPNGININADLPFNQHNITTPRSVRLYPNLSILTGVQDVGCVYEAGVDLYYNDANGNNIRLTESGGVAGSPGSISNLVSPASASYVSANQTFVWQSAALTPANLDAASIVLRNLTANSKGLTLNPPNAMGADYSIVFPVLPGASGVVLLDSSGNMTTTPESEVGLYTRNLNTVSTSTYTFQLTDSTDGSLEPCVLFTSSSAVTATIPLFSSVAFPVGCQIDVSQQGTGQVTFAAAPGVTLNSPGGLVSLASQFSAATLINTATNVWTLFGPLV